MDGRPWLTFDTFTIYMASLYSTAGVFLIIMVEFLWGYVFLRRFNHTTLAWCFPVGTVTAVHFLCRDESAVFRMFALIAVLFIGMKIVAASADKSERISWTRWGLFCFSWIGMRPYVFSKKADAAFPFRKYVRSGLNYFAFGLIILFGVKLLTASGFDPFASPVAYYSSSLVLLTGLSLTLHYGLLQLNAGLLRRMGYPAYRLFKNPWKARSLRDFWGNRWNRAFSEMTATAVYKPLSHRVGRPIAVLFTFIISGLLHEVALTLPVRANYGFPLMYFTLHGLLVLSEPIIFGNRKPGILWVVAWLILPLPLLFHRIVMNEIFWPIMGQGQLF